MMKRSWCVVLVLLALGVSLAPPVNAELIFGFTISNPETTFDGTDWFEVNAFSSTMSHVYRNDIAVNSSAVLLPATSGSAGFNLSMVVSDITMDSATGTGSFWLDDLDGDTIAGSLSGTWKRDGIAGKFDGSFSNVVVTAADDEFDGNLQGPMSTIFGSPQPLNGWSGSFTLLTADGAWFMEQPLTGGPWSLKEFDVRGGSLDATVTPVPAGVLLGILGLGAAGLKLRKYA